MIVVDILLTAITIMASFLIRWAIVHKRESNKWKVKHEEELRQVMINDARQDEKLDRIETKIDKMSGGKNGK